VIIRAWQMLALIAIIAKYAMRFAIGNFAPVEVVTL
jgi:hypothetical protein